MDLYPQTYRVMTEELIRERRISETPADINTIADPREYLYIEATSDQEGAALAFDVNSLRRGQTLCFGHGRTAITHRSQRLFSHGRALA